MPNLIILTNKMNRKPSKAPKYLYLIWWAIKRGEEQRIKFKERMREAEKACSSSWERRSRRRKLAWAVENSGENIRERMRDKEAESREKEAKGTVKFLGIWVILFVLICDYFVVNLLDWICSLSYWFLFV